MGTYYNPGRTALPVTLADGTSLSIPGKSRATLTAVQEGSESVLRAVRKQQLQRVDRPGFDRDARPPAPAAEGPIRFPQAEAPARSAEVEPEPVVEPLAPVSVEEDADHVVRSDEGQGLTQPGSRRSRRSP